MKKNYINNYGILLFMVLLISFIFINKYIYIAPNLNVNIGLFLYPFTYLLTYIIYNKTNITNTKQTIYFNFKLIIIFYLIISILNTIEGTLSSSLVTDSLRVVFTPNFIYTNNIYIYYPDIVNLLTYIVIYFITHYIFIVTYEAIKDSTNYLLGFTLAIFISFILNQMLYTPLVNIRNLINNTLKYNTLIEMMTANFIVVIFTSIIIIIIYLIYYKKHNSK